MDKSVVSLGCSQTKAGLDQRNESISRRLMTALLWEVQSASGMKMTRSNPSRFLGGGDV